MNKCIKKLLYCFFPRRCEMCGDICDIDSPLCDKCKTLSRIGDDTCDKCGKDKCRCDCKNSNHTPDYEKIIAPFYFEGNIVKAIHRLKFSDRCELSEAMAKEMVRVINKKYSDVHFDCVTFVPLSQKREKARHYNQSYLLAKYISAKLDIPLEFTFYKAYENPPQRNQSARKRRANVFGAFDINDNVDPADKTYLIVDDVKTTGSTLSECAAVLDSYSAKASYAVCVAIR